MLLAERFYVVEICRLTIVRRADRRRLLAAHPIGMQCAFATKFLREQIETLETVKRMAFFMRKS